MTELQFDLREGNKYMINLCAHACEHVYIVFEIISKNQKNFLFLNSK